MFALAIDFLLGCPIVLMDPSCRQRRMRQSEVATLFDYSYWAHRRVLATAARLTDGQFTLRSVIVGRDLRATLVHALDTECSWRLRLQGRPEEEWRKTLPASDYRNLAALVEQWARDEAEMRAWLETLAAAALAGSADRGPGPQPPLWFFLIHIVTHS